MIIEFKDHYLYPVAIKAEDIRKIRINKSNSKYYVEIDAKIGVWNTNKFYKQDDAEVEYNRLVKEWKEGLCLGLGEIDI